MQKLFITILLLAFNFLTFAQKEASNWYFGTHAAIDFHSNPPSVISGSAMQSNAGCASISDSAGNLLFYTDGMTVWNKNNNVMYNGSGLHGNSDATQSAVIVPQPGINNIFYLFTVDFAARTNGLNYSIINMDIDHGLGGITTKNISLFFSRM